jgi:hypothetical protein
MAIPFFSQVLASSRATGPTLASSTTATSLLNSSDLVQIPVGYLQVGTKFRIHAYGSLSNVVTTPGTITLAVMYNSVAVWSTGAVQMATTANSNVPFHLEAWIRCSGVGTGTSTTFIGGGLLSGLNVQLGSGVANGTVTDSCIVVPETAPANGTGTTNAASANLDFFGTFSISNAANSITIYNYSVEQLQ